MLKIQHLSQFLRNPIKRLAIHGIAKWMGVPLVLGLLGAATGARSPTVEVVAGGLKNPWALAFIGAGEILVSERDGFMRVVGAGGRVSAPLAGVPRVETGGQRGLLDVIVDKDFSNNRVIHFCFSEPGSEPGTDSTALASATLSKNLAVLENVKIIFSQKPKSAVIHHYGCRIVQAEDSSLFLTLGDRGRMQDAQTLNNHHGKIVRIRLDGSAHPENPYLGRPGALPEIWSIGHRNIQGATLTADGSLWVVEHGPVGGDELNRIEAGKNYGWPIISHGVAYGGGPIGTGLTAKDGLEGPIHHWTPAIAPSGVIAVQGDRYGLSWKPGLLVSALQGGLVRLEIERNRISNEERIQIPQSKRTRAVYMGPDGHMYIATGGGSILRLRFN